MRPTMHSVMLPMILVLLLAGCSAPQEPPAPTVSGIGELALTQADLQEFGMSSNWTGCEPQEYETGEFSSLAQYSMCTYAIDGLDTEVIIELKKFTNLNDLNGSYQYDSSHYFSADGLISQDTYGDQSKFRQNSVNDYGGEFNDPEMHYYHLWITKDTYLIHITSGGKSADAKGYIARIGERIMSRFE